ncbi:MAG: hypothetical protein V3W34_18900, partial [Phycisphaerae bacterium]
RQHVDQDLDDDDRNCKVVRPREGLWIYYAKRGAKPPGERSLGGLPLSTTRPDLTASDAQQAVNTWRRG